MKSQETIKLYVYVDGINDVPFYGDVSGVYEEFILANGEVFTTSNGFAFNVRHTNEQIEIGAFRYDAKRMGGAPTISFTLMYEDCLDNFWSDKVYAVFNDEKYFLKQIPTSSLSNEDARYKHTVELISERVALDNIYFFDAVVGNPTESDKAVSNSTKVTFFGSIHEFAKRLNASLEYTKLLKWEDGVNEDGEPIKIANGYNVVVDEGIGSEEKLMSFEDQFFSNVLQDIYNTYEIPYYFVGKTIHIGFSDDVYPHTFSYGVDDALISITKNNANFKVVNRVTGKGSTDNIPYYYPNNSPKGDIEAEVNTTSDDFEVSISDMTLFSDKVKPNTAISFIDDHKPAFNGETLSESKLFRFTSSKQEGKSTSHFEIRNDETVKDLALYFTLDMRNIRYYHRVWFDEGDGETATTWDEWVEQPLSSIDGRVIVNINEKDVYNDRYSPNDVLEFNSFSHDVSHIKVTFISYGVPIEIEGVYGETYGEQLCEGDIKITYNFFRKSESELYWSYNGRKVDLQDLGLSAVGDPNIGDTITQRLVKFVNTSQNLMPSVYRHSAGKERFYNAINYPYPKYEGFDETLEEGYYGEDGIQRNALGEYEIDGMIHNDAYKGADGEYIVFKNPYFEGTPKEHSISIEDLKPTIKEAVNSMGLRMDMFSEFAYDLDDNDETEENEDGTDRDFIHSYFFGKLRKLDFNLFEHAIEQQPMTISFTSGNCGACNFEIGVTEEFPQKNPVQVNADGSLKRDEKGRVICGQFQEITEDEIQDEQQDTSKNEVWIALKKEESTYGILMPKAPIDGVGGHRPKACTVNEDGTANNDGDTFVILGINLPDAYIHNAEDKLRNEIIKYIKENNTEKFNFSITFSRIFFAENPDVLQYLNENSRINVEYNGKTYTLYVTSYSYNMGEGDVLPEIRVELDDTLTLAQNALQNAISQVKSEVGMAFANYDVLAQASPYFLRKDVDDICNGKVDFKKGVKFGEGGKIEVLDNNSAKLTIEYLEVTKKASFTSLEIKERTHVGGQIIISPAAMTCGEVEELEDVYRCYFQTKDENDGEEIFNQFAENDLAICQTFNAWGSRYYWRKVVGIGEDYIDLSKTLCDEYSDIPMAGDKIVQLGNTDDATRQAAQVLSAYGEDAPSFIMYNGINDFTLADKNITGIIWNPNTLEPQMYSYGSFFFGDRNLENNFITFQRREGDADKSLHINADVTIGANSSGLTNLSEWKDKQAQIDKAQSDASTAQQIANVANASVSVLNTRLDGFDETIAEINNKLDGVVESYFEPYAPSRTNEPAATWIAEGTEADHVGDTFTNTELTGDNAGKSWRWLEKTDGTYDWQQIADSDAAKALALAAQAQAAADGKTTTFLRTPSNYKVGDIWIVGDDAPQGLSFKKGDILTTSNDSEVYVANHWSKYINYVDEFQSELDGTVANINQAIADAEQAAKGYTDEGKAALQKAINELDSAKAGINDVYTKAQADGKISTAEQAAMDAAQEYADAAQDLAEKTSKAYADGKISEAESRILATAQGYADAAQLAAEQNARSVADGLVNSAEERANKAAEEYADEAQRLAEETAAAYADGKVSEAEANAIAEAEKKVNAAKAELEEAISEVEGIANLANAATSNLDTRISNVETGVNESVAEINARLDGVVENYFEEGAPTTQNKPVTDWIAASDDDDYELINHVGDTYTNIQEYVNDETTPDAGKSWRWCWCNDASITDKIAVTDKEGITRHLHWHPIADSDAVKALLEASKAQTTADGKSKTFVTQPVPPYKEGDLWVQGESGDIYRCKNGVNRTSGSFTASDWEKASKYTDDTVANEAKALVESVSKRVSDADYLKDTFQKGSTEVAGGVVMSQMVAVRNSEEEGGEIEAFLNGSDFAKSDDSGKLILAGGIPAESWSGSLDLEDRAKEAKIRMYEDGDFILKGGGISVERGNIGPLYIGPNTIATNEKSGNEQTQVVIGQKDLALTHKISTGNAETDKDIQVSLGGARYGSYGYVADADYEKIFDLHPRHFIRGVSIEANDSGDDERGVFNIRRNGTGAKCAIQVDSGYFAGLRPRTRVIKSTANSVAPHDITDLDHTIIINVGSGTTYIKLPASPQEGQTYEIYTCHAAMALDINLNGKSLYDFVAGANRTHESFTTNYRRYITLVYAGGQWWEKYTYW